MNTIPVFIGAITAAVADLKPPLDGLWGRLKRIIGPGNQPEQDREVRDGVAARALIIDGSPSMLEPDWPPTRLAAAQEAAAAYVDRLACEDPDASIAIITYSASSRVVCGLTPASDVGTLKRAISRIRVNNYTNIRSGLEAAYTILKNRQQDAQAVLLTDGCHNTGADPRPVANQLKQFTTIECIGIGPRSEVDEELLRNIASRYPDGTPRYRWIGDREGLVQEFKNLAGRISRSK